MIFWLRHLQCVTKTISITHMLHLPTYRQESSISKKNNIQREKKNHLLHKIPSFKNLSPFFPLLFLKIYLQFDISPFQGNFIYFSRRFNHTLEQKRSFTYVCNKQKWVLGLPHAFPKDVRGPRWISHTTNRTQCLLLQF